MIENRIRELKDVELNLINKLEKTLDTSKDLFK
jgi:hypothetical protein